MLSWKQGLELNGVARVRGDNIPEARQKPIKASSRGVELNNELMKLIIEIISPVASNITRRDLADGKRRRTGENKARKSIFLENVAIENTNLNDKK